MIKGWRNNRAQSIAEYALTLTLVIATLVAMTVYVKRALQARMFDARNHMVETISNSKDNLGYVGNLRREYEPYYVKQSTDTDMSANEQVNLDAGDIFRRRSEQDSRAQTNTVQLAPVNADTY